MTSWLNYLVRVDFTEISEMLQDVPVGPLNDEDQRTVAAVLDSYGPAEDAGKWNMDPVANEYTLNGAEVVFNDRNNPNLPTFSTYKYALGLRFPDRSIGPVGTLYLCWNDPVLIENPADTDPATEE